MAHVGVGRESKQTPAADAKHSQRRFRLDGVRMHRMVKGASAVAAAALIFATGVGVGNGRIYTGMLAKTQSGLPANLNYKSVNQLYQLVRAQYDGKVTGSQLLDGMKNGLVSALGDPYSEYFTAAQATNFNNQLEGTFSGIGAELDQDSNGVLEIIAPIAGSPAAKAGLQPRDLITAIDGKTTNGMTIDNAVTAIRGKEGTKVTLTVTRGSTQGIQVPITRAQITVPSVVSSVIAGTHIGYIQITQFSDDTGNLAATAAQNLLNQHVQGIILDLRDNPGGLVDAAVGVSSLWLPSGTTIMQTKRGNTVEQTYTADGGDILKDTPTVVLINGGTASAAEITAGALHDDGAATIVGEKSYGKGVMQQVNPLPGGAEVKITVASWYRPDGQNINHKGITPDKIVTLTAADAQAGNDPQKAAAEAMLTK